MATASPPVRSLSTAEVAEILGSNRDKVIAFIRSGELKAFNSAIRPDGERPRWRILESDLRDFLARRAAVPTGTTTAKPRRKRAADYPEFIPL